MAHFDDPADDFAGDPEWGAAASGLPAYPAEPADDRTRDADAVDTPPRRPVSILPALAVVLAVIGGYMLLVHWLRGAN